MIDYKHRLAFDRSSRVVDPTSGHMFIPACTISAAVVSGYRGDEVPNASRLGMDANRVYPLLRDPRELQKAASSFEGRPLMLAHRAQSADDHDREAVVGSISNVKWNAPNLQADLAVWDGEAIALIESGAQKSLSCGYFYDVDPTPGTYDGQRYFGRMTNIKGNHCALVTEGRVPGAMVGDAALKTLRKMVMAKDAGSMGEALSALIAFLQEKMQDPKLDEIATMVDGGLDDSGATTPAMDRIIKRRAATAGRSTAAQTAAREARFVHGNRLIGS